MYCTGESKLQHKITLLFVVLNQPSVSCIELKNNLINKKNIKKNPKKTGNSFQSGPNLMSFVFNRGVGCKITHFSRDPSVKSWRKP